MKRMALISMIAGLAVFATAAAQPPVHDVSAKRHPNLAAAQRLVDQAYKRVAAAQQANEFDLGGHAARAKELLDQANAELKQAAETANENHR
jgi:F0F1-type ATP synthase membrane subunit b/b'